MVKRIICISLFVLLLQTNETRSRTFTYGVINEFFSEFKAVNIAFSNVTSANNVSLIIRMFNISRDTNLVKQALVFLQQNIVALFEGSHTKTSACALSTVTGIPVIHLHGGSRLFDRCDKAVEMSAGYKAYAHASVDILNTFRWKRIALVFDESRLHEAGYFFAITQSSKFIVNHVQLYEREANEDQTKPMLRAMQQIRNINPEVIFLYTNKNRMELMLQQVQPCLREPCHIWLLQGQVPLNLSCHPNNVVLAMKLPYKFDNMEHDFGSNCSHTNKEFIAHSNDAVQALARAVNREPCSSINETVIGSNEREAMWSCLKKVNLEGVTGHVQFNDDGERTGIELNILNLRNTSFVKIGTWNQTTRRVVLFGEILRNKESPYAGGRIEGRKLRAVFAETAPFVMKKVKEDGTISYEGYCIDLLNELARILKFTFEIYPSPDGLYGAVTENGTWNGMIAELINKHADIIVSDLTITESREKVVDFSIPFMPYTEEILLKKPSLKGQIDLLQFLEPFDSYVWFATLASLVVTSIAVYVINYFSPYGYKDENGRGTSKEFSYSNSLWFAVACMLQQGASDTPRNLSGRIITGCYWFCVIIFISSYTANLAAFFTVKSAESPIRNIEDLAKSTYQVTVVHSSSSFEALKSSQYETHKKIFQRIVESGTEAQSLTESIQWVREKDKFVYIEDGPAIRYAANQPPCDLKTVPGLSTAKGLALALQANDPHTSDFTLAILHLHESNFLDQLKNKWWKISNGCPKEQEKLLSQNRINLTSMMGVYVVLAVGISTAFLTLIAEILWKRKAKWKKGTKIRPKLRSTQVQPAIQQ